MTLKSLGSFVFVTAFLLAASPAVAQHRGGGGGGGGMARGGAVVRGGGGVVRGGGVAIGRPIGVAPRVIYPRVVGYGFYRPYFYYRPGISIGFYGGFGYPYYYPYYGYPYPYYSPYGSYYGYGYPYPGYSYPGYPSGYYPPADPPQQQAPPQQGSVTTQQQPMAYGGVQIEGAAQHDAQVYVDGQYAGIVDDFSGGNKHLNLTAGTHQIEIRPNGQQGVQFDVNVPANQTITLRMP